MGLLISICDDCINRKSENMEENEVLVKKCFGRSSFITKSKGVKHSDKVEVIQYEPLDKKKHSEKKKASYYH